MEPTKVRFKVVYKTTTKGIVLESGASFADLQKKIQEKLKLGEDEKFCIFQDDGSQYPMEVDDDDTFNCLKEDDVLFLKMIGEDAEETVEEKSTEEKSTEKENVVSSKKQEIGKFFQGAVQQIKSDVVGSHKQNRPRSVQIIKKNVNFKNKDIIKNSLLAIQAVSHENPSNFFEKNELGEPSFNEYEVTVLDEPRYMLCYGEKLLIVAFDTVQSLSSILYIDDEIEETGIEKMASRVPIHFYLEYLKEGYEIVFCGMSVGGSIAALVCLNLLHLLEAGAETHQFSHDKIRCITFGANLFVKKDNLELHENYAKHFTNYVHKDDILPRSIGIYESLRWSNMKDPSEKNEEVVWKFDKILSDPNKLRPEEKEKKAEPKKASLRRGQLPKKKKVSIIKGLTKLEEEHMQYVLFGDYMLFPNAEGDFELRSHPAKLEALKLPKKKSEIREWLARYPSNLLRKYSIEEMLYSKKSTKNHQNIETIPKCVDYHRIDIEELKVCVYPNRITTVIILRAPGNLEFVTTIHIPQLKVENLRPSRLMKDSKRIRFEVKTPSQQDSVIEKEVEIQIKSQFGQKIYRKTIPPEKFKVTRNLAKEKEAKVATMSLSTLLFKSFILYSVFKKLNFKDKYENIRWCLESLLSQVTFEDYVLSLCDNSILKSFLEDVELQNKKEAIDPEKQKIIENQSFSLLGYQHDSQNPSISSKYRNVRKEISPRTLAFFSHLEKKDLEVKIKKRQKKDILSHKDYTYHIMQGYGLKPEGIQRLLQEKIDFSSLSDSSKVREDLLFIVNILQFLMNKPEEIILSTDKKKMIGTSIVFHSLLLPLDIITGALGTITAPLLMLLLPLFENEEDRSASTYGLGLLGALIGPFIGAGAGVVIPHVILHMYLNNETRVVSNYASKLILFIMIANQIKKDLFEIDERLPQSEAVYLMERQISDLEDSVLQELKMKIDPGEIIGDDDRKFSNVLKDWRNNIRAIHTLRQLLIKTTGIAAVGTSKVGKSTFLSKMWECNSKPDYEIPTKSITPFYLDKDDNFMIIDFPGSDEINETWRLCRRDGLELASLYVIISECNKVNQGQKDLVDEITNADIPCILLLNQADLLFMNKCLPHKDDEEKMKNILKQFKHQKIAKLDNPKILEDNVFFTCFDDSRVPQEYRELMYSIGILDIEKLRKEMVQILDQNGIENSHDIMHAKAINRKEMQARQSVGINEDTDASDKDFHMALILLHLYQQLLSNKAESLKVDRYIIKEELGRGGQGVALLVYDKVEKKEKVIKKIYVATTEEHEFAMKEVEVSKKLVHKNLVKIDGIFEEKYDGYSAICIVMQYYRGGDLAKLIAQHKQKDDRIPQRTLIKIMYQMAEVLCYIHDQGVIHRDIKPQNIFLNDSDQIVLGDFGVYKQTSPDKSNKTKHVGTPMFFAPEMILAQFGSYTTSVDIWCAGCVFYEMMVLSLPKNPFYLEVKKPKFFDNFKKEAQYYDNELVNLVYDMLQFEPEFRVSTKGFLKRIQQVEG